MKRKRNGRKKQVTLPPMERIVFEQHKDCVQINIKSWDEFFALIQKMRYGEWYFRGHQDCSWKLRTGVDRVRENWKNRFSKSVPKAKSQGVQLLNNFDFKAYRNSTPMEHDLELIGINEFRSLTRDRFSSSFTALDYLGAMQHYGVHTRLLDFSFSAFVAAFFAFENEDTFTQRSIFALNVNQFKLCSHIMRDVDAFIEKNYESEPPLCKILERKFDDRHPALWDIYRYIANVHIGREEDVKSENDIIPVVLEGVNSRLTAQDGLFLFPLSFNYFDEVLATMFGLKVEDIATPQIVPYKSVKKLSGVIENSTLVKFVFDEYLNDTAHQVLKHVNLSHRVIYPDLIGIARSVNGIRDEMMRR